MAYNGCKIRNYSRINPNTGAGFILSRLATRNMTKREVYEGTHYGHWTPGYHSSIWAKLLEDGLIMPWNGFMDVSNSASPYAAYPWKAKTHIRAKGHIEAHGKYIVRYFITDLGKQTLAKMNERLDKIRENKKEFCTRNGIQFGTGKLLKKMTTPELRNAYAAAAMEADRANANGEFEAEKIAAAKSETYAKEIQRRNSGKAVLDKLEHFDPSLAERLDNIIRELQEIRASL